MCVDVTARRIDFFGKSDSLQFYSPSLVGSLHFVAFQTRNGLFCFSQFRMRMRDLFCWDKQFPLWDSNCSNSFFDDFCMSIGHLLVIGGITVCAAERRAHTGRLARVMKRELNVAALLHFLQKLSRSLTKRLCDWRDNDVGGSVDGPTERKHT